MPSMYDTIMDLPLFKGISTQQVSDFLEKTKLEFINYERGDTIYNRTEACTHIRYLIKGSIRLIHSHISGCCAISEILRPGCVLGAERLFGLNTIYSDTAVAETDSSILRFSKEQFLNLLDSDRIYLINVLNFLSLRAQRPVDALAYLYSGTLMGHFAFWISTMTDRDAVAVELKASVDDLSRLTSIPAEDVRYQLIRMRNKGLIAFAEDTIRIRNRRSLIEHALESNRKL